ncbi:RES family NAD+ phosphorylase [Kosakonia cowanii]|uniref:RES family NAD+ phosphorylase n=1 Tax=Kosakonia cowanii TaxID=208223 RepID=UPI003D648CDD
MNVLNELTTIEGIFYRAIDPAYRELALAGSRNPGRYSSAEQPTLYLSSSPEGVEAAMQAHKSNRSADLEIIRLRVHAVRVFDLRNADALSAAGIDLRDAVAPWQEIVAAGGTPSSWRVRQQLETLGAAGLIDPSRKAPGLWHLVLFSWNRGVGQPEVEIVR